MKTPSCLLAFKPVFLMSGGKTVGVGRPVQQIIRQEDLPAGGERIQGERSVSRPHHRGPSHRAEQLRVRLHQHDT